MNSRWVVSRVRQSLLLSTTVPFLLCRSAFFQAERPGPTISGSFAAGGFHAWDLINSGGRLVSLHIISKGLRFTSNWLRKLP